VTIAFQGTATCSGTITIQAKAAAFSSQTEDSNILSFAVTGSTCSTDATLSVSSKIKGATINSLGTPNNVTASVVRGSVTLTSTQAADTSNSGSFVTSFIKSNADASIPVIRKAPSGTAVTSISSSFAYNGNAAVSDGDIFLVRVSPRAGSTLTYVIDVTVTSGINSSSSPATCSADFLSSSSTIKGVAFSSGTKQATSTDFNGSGSSNMGSITLTADQASGNGVTSIVATGGATATWLHVGPSISSWGNNDISTTADLVGVTLVNGQLFEIKISGSGCTDYYRISITVPSSSNQNSQQSAQQAAAAAATAAAETAALLAAAIAKAKVVLTTQFSANKPATVDQFLDAGYGVRNNNVAAKVSAAILKLPVADRENAQKVNEIINLENFIDRVAVTDTRSTVKSTELISRGLLPVDSTKKHSVVQGLASYPDGSLNSMEKIEAAIKEQIFKAEAPKRRTAEIRAKIAARKK
jgi:hypothetical protein